MSNEPKFRDAFYIIGEIGVERSQLDRYCHYALKIEKMIDNDEQVPTAWVKTLLSYYRNVGRLEKEYYAEKNKKIIDDYTKEALEYFSMDKRYMYSGTYERDTFASIDFKFLREPLFKMSTNSGGKKNERRKHKRYTIAPAIHEYSTEKLLRFCISAYATFCETRDSGRGEITKDEAIHFFFKEVNTYTDACFNELDKENFTPYKRQVIAGYLTNKVAGFWLSEKLKTKFCNKYIFQATRNAFRPKKIKA